MQNDSTIAPARARTEEMTSSRGAVVGAEIEPAERDALRKIAGLACDIQNLIDISATPDVVAYQRDAAASAARGLATLIGAIAVGVNSDPPMPVSVSVWLLGGQA
jgi:hypothetical protein